MKRTFVTAGLVVLGLAFTGCGGHGAPPVPLTVTALDPVPDSVLGSAPTAITITFSTAVDPSTLSDTFFVLTRSGGDGTFDDGNEVVIAPDSLTLTAENDVTMSLASASLPDDTYLILVAGSRGGGQALLFDGVDDFVSAPQWLKGSGSTVTMEAWCRQPGVYGPMVLHRASWNDTYLFCGTAVSALFVFEIPGDEHARYEGPDPLNGFWYHVAGTYDGSVEKLYVNGELKDTNPVSKTIDWDSGFFGSYIGGDGHDGWGGFFVGEMDEIRIWDVARTQSDLQANIYRKLNGYEAGLVGYYSFDEGSGQTAQDGSTSGNHAVLGANSSVNASDPAWVPSLAPLVGGVTSTAGRVLDGEFSATFPSGDGTPGGDFVATFVVTP